jgi:hypothetical protein
MSTYLFTCAVSVDCGARFVANVTVVFVFHVKPRAGDGSRKR